MSKMLSLKTEHVWVLSSEELDQVAGGGGLIEWLRRSGGGDPNKSSLAPPQPMIPGAVSSFTGCSVPR